MVVEEKCHTLSLIQLEFLLPQETILHALKIMPMKKAPGPDGVFTEMIVAAGEYGLEELTRLTNMVYNHGHFQEELNKAIFITLQRSVEQPNVKNIVQLA